MPDYFGCTPLHAACADGGHFEIVQLLLEKGAVCSGPVIQDLDGFTPLHKGASGGDLRIVRMLVENGVDLVATDKILGYTR